MDEYFYDAAAGAWRADGDDTWHASRRWCAP